MSLRRVNSQEAKGILLLAHKRKAQHNKGSQSIYFLYQKVTLLNHYLE